MGLDNWLTDRIHRSRARRDATRFANTVVPGRTYYSVETCVDPTQSGGTEARYQEWVFTHKSRLKIGDPKCGHMSPQLAWLNYGPLVEKKPTGIRGLYDDTGKLNKDVAEQLVAQINRATERQLAGG
jgi:hypothetical protein